MMENYDLDYMNFEPSQTSIMKEVLTGLSKSQKAIPAKLLYDKRGSEIFEKICQLKEYYPTRAETEILKNHAREIAEQLGPEVVIIEPGSGAGEKIRHLLPYMFAPAAYVAIEISREILLRTVEELAHEFPALKVQPVCADFNELNAYETSLPHGERNVIFFPGSTIGNFNPQEAIDFLKHYGRLVGPGGGLLIGVDLKKDPDIFSMAYDDPHGVTAAFNLNLLERLNREVSAHFDPQNFTHEAHYNEKLGRVEMHLVSKLPQLVKVNESVFRFREGESIHTENSYKYTVEEFAELCSKARFKLIRHWQDSNHLFCVYYFERE